MKNKIAVIFMVTLLFATIFSLTVLGKQKFENKINISIISNESIELEDQHNSAEHIDASSGIPLYKEWCLAQEFIPTKQSLSKVSLIIGKFGNPPANSKITVSIRNSLDSDPLTSKQINMDTISTSKVIFDFPDINVIPGNEYFIVCNIDKHDPFNAYYWFYTINDKYENGDSWFSLDCWHWFYIDDVVQFTGADFGFTTYWIDYGPENPEINGPTEGKAQERYYYLFTTNDPEGHDVRYYIEWGDGNSFKWIGPYSSGEIVNKSHQWASENDYTIRVKTKDIYGAESNWTELEIHMIKTKAFYSTIQNLLENHPNLFPILRKILGL